jgi:hypothetical protein
MSEIIDNFGGLPPEHSNPAEFPRRRAPRAVRLTSTWMKGADKGPQAIIKASQTVELYDIENRFAGPPARDLHVISRPSKAMNRPRRWWRPSEARSAAHLANDKFRRAPGWGAFL